MIDPDRIPPHDDLAEKSVLGLAVGGSDRTRPPGEDFLAMANIVSGTPAGNRTTRRYRPGWRNR